MSFPLNMTRPLPTLSFSLDPSVQIRRLDGETFLNSRCRNGGRQTSVFPLGLTMSSSPSTIGLQTLRLRKTNSSKSPKSSNSGQITTKLSSPQTNQKSLAFGVYTLIPAFSHVNHQLVLSKECLLSKSLVLLSTKLLLSSSTPQTWQAKSRKRFSL